MVEKGDLIQKDIDGRNYADVFMCVCADAEVFVIGRAKFKRVDRTENGVCSIEYEVCGVSYENLRAFPNTEEALKDNNLTLLYKESTDTIL